MVHPVTGCRDGSNGCDVVWDDPLRYKWASLVGNILMACAMPTRRSRRRRRRPAVGLVRAITGLTRLVARSAAQIMNSSRRFLALCSASMH